MPCHSSILHNVNGALTWKKPHTCDFCSKVFSQPSTCHKHEKRCPLKRVTSILLNGNTESPMDSLCAFSEASRVNSDAPSHGFGTSSQSPPPIDMTAGFPPSSMSTAEKCVEDNDPNKPDFQVHSDGVDNVAGALSSHDISSSQSDVVKTQTSASLTYSRRLQEENFPYGISGIPTKPAYISQLQNDVDKVLTWRKSRTCDFCNTVFTRPATCRKHKKRCRLKQVASSVLKDNAGNILASLAISGEANSVNSAAPSHGSGTSSQSPLLIDMMADFPPPSASTVEKSARDDYLNAPASEVPSDGNDNMANALSDHDVSSSQSDLVKTQAATFLTYNSHLQDKFSYGISGVLNMLVHTSQPQNDVDKVLARRKSCTCDFCNKVFARPATCHKHKKRCRLKLAAGNLVKDNVGDALASLSASRNANSENSEIPSHRTGTSSQSLPLIDMTAGFPPPSMSTSETYAKDDDPNKLASEVQSDRDDSVTSALANPYLSSSHSILVKTKTVASLTHSSRLQEKFPYGSSGVSTKSAYTSPLLNDVNKVLTWRKSRACDFCNKVFSRPSNRRKHEKRCRLKCPAVSILEDNAENPLASLSASSEPSCENSETSSHRPGMSNQSPPVTDITAGFPSPSMFTSATSAKDDDPNKPASEVHFDGDDGVASALSNHCSQSSQPDLVKTQTATSVTYTSHLQKEKFPSGISRVLSKPTCTSPLQNDFDRFLAWRKSRICILCNKVFGSPSNCRKHEQRCPVMRAAGSVVKGNTEKSLISSTAASEHGNGSSDTCNQGSSSSRSPPLIAAAATSPPPSKFSTSPSTATSMGLASLAGAHTLNASQFYSMFASLATTMSTSATILASSVATLAETAQSRFARNDNSDLSSIKEPDQEMQNVGGHSDNASDSKTSQESPGEVRLNPLALWEPITPLVAMISDNPSEANGRSESGSSSEKDCPRSVMHCNKKKHKNPKPYECSIYKKSYVNKNKKSHTKLHVGGKPYQCPICFAKFHYSSALNRHSLCYKSNASLAAATKSQSQGSSPVGGSRAMKVDPALTASMSKVEMARKNYDPRVYSPSSPIPQNLFNTHSSLPPSVTQAMSQSCMMSQQFLGSPTDFLSMLSPSVSGQAPQSDALDLSKSNTQQWRKSSSFPTSNQETPAAPQGPNVPTYSASTSPPASSHMFLSTLSGMEGGEQQGSQEDIGAPKIQKEVTQNNHPFPRRYYHHKRKARLDETIERLIKRKSYRKTAAQSPSQDLSTHECTPRSQDLKVRKAATRENIHDIDSHQTTSQSSVQDVSTHENIPSPLSVI